MAERGRPGDAAAGGAAGGDAVPRPRLARRRRRWKVLIFAGAVAAVISAAAWVLFGSSLLVVRTVRVTGTGALVSRGQVVAAARVPLGVPLIRVSDGAVARRVEQIPQVLTATVSTDWPGTVVISVRPRVPVFAVAGRRGYALIDRSGVTVRSAAAAPRSLPLLAVRGSGPGATLRGSPAVRAAAAVFAGLPRTVAARIRAVTVAGGENVTLRLAGGVLIIWGDPARSWQKARELAAVIHTGARVYDVSGYGTVMTRG